VFPGQCFAGYEKSDVLRFGKKIAGAAQRRTKDGLLIQGSVQPPPAEIRREAWQDALCSAAQKLWSVDCRAMPAIADLAGRANQLATEKYSRDKYNRRR
jgi:lipoyl(octanoyl) transferase